MCLTGFTQISSIRCYPRVDFIKCRVLFIRNILFSSLMKFTVHSIHSEAFFFFSEQFATQFLLLHYCYWSFCSDLRCFLMAVFWTSLSHSSIPSFQWQVKTLWVQPLQPLYYWRSQRASALCFSLKSLCKTVQTHTTELLSFSSVVQ